MNAELEITNAVVAHAPAALQIANRWQLLGWFALYALMGVLIAGVFSWAADEDDNETLGVMGVFWPLTLDMMLGFGLFLLFGLGAKGIAYFLSGDWRNKQSQRLSGRGFDGNQ